MRRSSLWSVIVIGGCGWAVGTADGATKFYYKQFEALPGGRTYARALNANGVAAGSSGDFAPGFHVYVSGITGQLQNVDTLNCTSSDAYAINDVGQVACHLAWKAANGPGTMAIGRYTPGVGMENLGKLTGGQGFPAAINDHGDVVGYWSIAPTTPVEHAFRYTDEGGMVDLGTLGGTESWASDINNAGLVVGQADDAAGIQHAVVWQNGVIQDLGAPGDTSRAIAVNEAGLVVGSWATYSPHTSGAFYWTSAGGLQLIALPAGVEYVNIAGINEQGMVAGTYQTGFQQLTAFYVTPGQDRVDLPQPAGMIGIDVTAINNLGHFVGSAADPNYDIRPYYYSIETGYVDLLDAITPTITWWGPTPVAINDRDQILLQGSAESNQALAAIVAPACRGDGNCDAAIDWRDIDLLVAGMNDNESGWVGMFSAAGPACLFSNLDVDGDGHVNWRDIDPFIAKMNTPCE